MRSRVAITGLGVISPLGNHIDEVFGHLMAGTSGIRTLSFRDLSRMRAPVGAPAQFSGPDHFDAARCRMLDRVSQMALIAAGQAVTNANIDFGKTKRERCGVSVGCSMGGVTTTDDAYYALYGENSDRVQPFNILAAMTNAPAAWIAIEHGLSGPSFTYATACSSSALAIGEAGRRIQSGEVDMMIAGGAEAPLTFGVMRAWEAMRTLAVPDLLDASMSCRPFSKTRTGMVIGEGAAFLVLESWDHALSRGAKILAELSGYGLATDLAHITRPTVDGQAGAMQAALESCGMSVDSVDYINAHGTATAQNDAVETAAIKKVFGARAYEIPVSSTKSTHGHLMGAAGALEFVICIGCLVRRAIPPTMHLNVADPVCDLDYVANKARQDLQLCTAMSNSFAFGGTNATLIASSVV